MLEELADDRADANALRETWHARSQRAHAADEKIDLGAGLRGRVQRVDDLLVDQVVDLDDDPAPDHALSLDQLSDARAQVGRCDEQLAIAALPAVSGQQVEELGDVGAEVRVSGQKTDALVPTRGAALVAPRSDVQVALDVTYLE